MTTGALPDAQGGASPCQIRRLQARDVVDYHMIRLSALQGAPDAFGSVYAVEAARPLQDVAEALVSSHVFGAFAAGRIVGIGGFRRQSGPKDKHKANVLAMYVLPECRRRGVGSALLDAIKTEAAIRVEQLLLSCVSGNAAALALYRRHGFATYGVEPRALKTASGYADEVHMVLMLRRD